MTLLADRMLNGVTYVSKAINIQMLLHKIFDAIVYAAVLRWAELSISDFHQTKWSNLTIKWHPRREITKIQHPMLCKWCNQNAACGFTLRKKNHCHCQLLSNFKASDLDLISKTALSKMMQGFVWKSIILTKTILKFFKNTYSLKICIALIFDKCSILQQTQSPLHHKSYWNFHFNEFVANDFRDNIGS